MGTKTGIEWTDHTFNPWIGCTKVSAGCANCYAENLMDQRWKKVAWGPGKDRKRTKPAYWREPLKWDQAAAAAGERRRVFCASLADVFDEEVWSDWRSELFDLILRTPNLDWLILTKRAKQMRDFMENWLQVWPGASIANIWLGVSVEDQKTADERIPFLLESPAAIRFVSYEPALDPVDFTEWLRPTFGPNCVQGPSNLNWIIVGGESGADARVFHLEWALSTIMQCHAAGVACFVKQLGRHPYVTRTHKITGNPCTAPFSTSDLKGGNPAEWPSDLIVRQFPIANRLDKV